MITQLSNALFGSYNMDQDSDLAILRQISGGSAQALELLYARYGPMLLRFLSSALDNRQEAEDLLQDIFLVVWQRAASFRGESSVKTWLFAIAHKRVITLRRRSQPMFSFDRSAATRSTDESAAVDTWIVRVHLEHALQRISSDHRMILGLVFYHQFSGAEISQVLGVPLGTVKSRLSRAKEALRAILEQEEAYDA